MKGLFLKDYYNLRMEYLSYAALLVLTAGSMVSSNLRGAVLPIVLRSLPVYFGFAATSLSLNSFSYDEGCGYMKYVLATPVSRRTYIIEKHLFLLIHSAAGMLLGTLCAVVLTAIFGQSLNTAYVAQTAAFAGGCFTVTMMVGIWGIGFSVRFHSTMARTLSWVIFICLFLLTSNGSMLELLLSREGILLVAILFVAVLFIFTVWMFCMSFIWMKRKEF